MKLIKPNPGTQPERLKKVATICLMSGGIALMFGAVIVRWVDTAIAFSLACFVTALLLVFWAKASSRG